MENIKRIAQQKEKKRREREAQKQQEALEKSKAIDDTKSERIRKFSSESYESSNPYRKSISVKITDLDTSHTTELEEQELESFTSKFKFDTLGYIEVSEQFLTAKSAKELILESFAMACERGDVELMKSYLSEGKVDVNVELEDERNCLHLVINSSRMSLKAFALLLQYKIDTNKRNRMGRTPLILASLKSNFAICNLLIENGCDLNIQDMYGNTAMHYACIHGWHPIVKMLLENKAKICIKNKKSQIAEQCCSSGQVLRLFNTKYECTRTTFDDYVQKNRGIQFKQRPLQKNLEQSAPINVSQSTESSSEAGKSNNKWRQKLQQKYQNLIKSDQDLQQSEQSFSKVSLLDFKVIDMLGKGSFGMVYLVEQEETKQLFAMKVLSKAQIKANKLMHYVETEKKILSMVKHPFIVGLHYAFQTHDKLILIMTYCPGGDLLQLTRRNKRLSQEQIKLYAAEIVLGLQCLHKAEIIYRDLKPANVVLDKDGHACITDFGLAKESEIGHSFCGSMAYLAPQMLARRGHTRRIDWYLLGVLIYQCYNGKPPFWDTTRDKLVMNIKSGVYVPFQASEEMKDIVSKLLKSNPSQRLGGTNDAEQVKAHPWFAGVNWKDVQQRKQPMPQIFNPFKVNEKTQKKSLFTQQDIYKGTIIDRVPNWQYSV